MSALEEFCWKLRRKYFPPEVKYGRNDSDETLQSRMQNPLFLERHGFRVYSQFDEDGIIEEIFRRIGTESKTFVEFGVQDGLESNAHFLLHKGWSGLWLEGSKKQCKKIQKLFAKPIAQKRLTIRNCFVTASNINQIIGGYLSGAEHFGSTRAREESRDFSSRPALDEVSLNLAQEREKCVSTGGGGEKV